MAKTSKNKGSINPIDAEITEIMEQPNVDPQNENITPVEISTFQKVVNEINPAKQEVQEIETSNEAENSSEFTLKINNGTLPSRYKLLEIVYVISDDIELPVERKEMIFDFTEILLDLDTVLSFEKVYEKRLLDFGIDEDELDDLEENHDRYLLDGCIVHSSAFVDPIIVTEYSFEEMITFLLEYRNERS